MNSRGTRRIAWLALLVVALTAGAAWFLTQQSSGIPDGPRGGPESGMDRPRAEGAARTPRRAGSGRAAAREPVNGRAVAGDQDAGSPVVRVHAPPGVDLAGASLWVHRIGSRLTFTPALDSTGSAGFGFEEDEPVIVSVRLPPGLRETHTAAARLLRRPKDLDVILEALSPLSGVVSDAGGSPVPGVTLAAVPAGLVPLSDTSRPAEQQSSADGGFRFLVPRGTWRLFVRPDYRHEDPFAERLGPFAAGTEGIRVVVEGRGGGATLRGPRIEGVARRREGGSPNGWMWFLRPLDPGETMSRVPHIALEAGRFRSSALRADRLYDLVLRCDEAGIGSGWAILRGVAPGTSGHVLVPAPPRELAGRVTDAAGDGVAGVDVRATLDPDITIDPFDVLAFSGPDGRFRFPRVPPFEIRLVAGGADESWYSASPVLVPEGVTSGVELRVERTATAAGRLVLDDGTPVRGGTVFGGSRETDVAEDGAFRLTGLVPGATRVHWTPGFTLDIRPALVGTLTAPCGDAVLTLRLPE